MAPRFGADVLAANLAKVARLEAAAAAKGVTPSQLALAWLQAQVRLLVLLAFLNSYLGTLK